MERTVKGIGLKELFKAFWEPDKTELDLAEVDSAEVFEKFNIDKKTADELASSKKKIKQLEAKYAVSVGAQTKKKKTIGDNKLNLGTKSNMDKSRRNNSKDEDLMR